MIERHVADALSKGARRLASAAAMPSGKQYATPTVLGEATTDMMLAGEETFGPVAPLFRFRSEEEALAIAPFDADQYRVVRGVPGEAWVVRLEADGRMSQRGRMFVKK